MLKLGLVRLDQLAKPCTWYGARKLGSLLLLRDLHAAGSRVPEHYNGILRLLRMANGTWKDTRTGRFGTLDQAILEVARETRPQGGRLVVSDLGVASGVTSVELYQTLRSAFELDFVATDLWRDAIAIGGFGAGWTIIVDVDGHELQYLIGPFVLPGQGHELVIYPVNRALRWLARRLHRRRALSVIAVGDRLPQADFVTQRIDDLEVTRIPLLSMECIELLGQQAGFRFLVADILRPLGRRSDIIRAMNIITPSHFGEAELRTAIRSCLQDLSPGGLLVLGRSPSDDPRQVKATIYLDAQGTIRAARRLNGGCEVEALVEEESARLLGLSADRRPPVAPS